MIRDRGFYLDMAGPILAGYLDTPDLIEVTCNDNGTAFLTCFGEATKPVAHPGWAELDRFLRVIADATPGVAWHESSPELSTALPGVGWRIEAGRPPVSPALFMSLRVHPGKVFPLADYVRKGILTAQDRTILEQAMASRKRLLVAGGTGSAKTSLINACLQCLTATEERVLLIEDDPELLCAVPNSLRRRVYPGGSLHALVRRSLRLRPDWIVVGEVRGAEALDMLKIFQTGHAGLCSVHVDDAAHALQRLEQCVQEVSVSPQRELIGQVIDLVVHMARVGTTWRCTEILAVDGWQGDHYAVRSLRSTV